MTGGTKCLSCQLYILLSVNHIVHFDKFQRNCQRDSYQTAYKDLSPWEQFSWLIFSDLDLQYNLYFTTLNFAFETIV